MRRLVTHTLCGAIFLLILPALVGVASAQAESSWWHVSTSTSPTNLPPDGEGRIEVLATDLGDQEYVNGEQEPVTVTDELPPGFTATGMTGRAGPIGLAGPMECEVKTLTCTYTGQMRAYQSLQVYITVKDPAASEGENEVTVAGGEAPSVSNRHRVLVSEKPTPFGIESYELTPEEEGGAPARQAGSHPFQVTTRVALNRVPIAPSEEERPDESVSPASVKDLHFALPAGLIGNPTPFPECPDSAFMTNQCPGDTAVGVANVTINEPSTFGNLTLPEALYSLVPTRGEPARFGFYAFAIPVYLDTSVRTGGDYGVTVSVNNISELASLLSSEVTFWGVPGDPRHNAQRGTCVFTLFNENPCAPEFVHRPPPLLTMPTSCEGPWKTTLTGDSWMERGKFLTPVESSFEDSLDGCNRLSFSPELNITPDGHAASTPTGLTVDVHIPQEETLSGTGTAQSTLKNTTVTLPPGVAIDPAGGDGLLSCTESELALESPRSPTCPNASKIGTVEVTTPLLPNPLEGAVYLGAQDANPFDSLVAMYIVAEDPTAGVVVKFPGKVELNPVTGQLVTSFENTPQLPFEDLRLHFFGGARAPLATPAMCGTYTTDASFAPWSGNPPATPTSSFEINTGPNSSLCHDPLPFVPELAAGTTSIQAGGFTPFTMTLSREDGNQNLSSIELHMPPGLSGTLSKAALCPEAQANEGTCGPESLIGETTVSVGLGGDPFTVKGGKVYLTGPYRGAPFGLSIVNPAKAGPFDLEDTLVKKPACDCLVVRAKIEVNPITAALTITSNPPGTEYSIPTILEGIPLEIKHVNVTINRPEFTFNPTNCSKFTITGTLMSTENASDTLSFPFQATNCAVLSFKPHVEASTSGKTSRAQGASLHVTLSYSAGPYDTNIARFKLDLPRQLPSRLSTLQKACTIKTFEANPALCPVASMIGHAHATTPLIPVPLEGPMYFVSHGGEKFPEVIIVLQGYGVRIDLHGETFINKAGVTSSTFATVPDAPVGRFEATLPEGPDSALSATTNLCKAKLIMPTEIVAQNGAELHENARISVTGCPKVTKAGGKHKGHKGKRRKKK